MMNNMESLLTEALQNDPSINFAIQVNIQEQSCYVFDRNSEVFKTYPVSMSLITYNLRNYDGTPIDNYVDSYIRCVYFYGINQDIRWVQKPRMGVSE